MFGIGEDRTFRARRRYCEIDRNSLPFESWNSFDLCQGLRKQGLLADNFCAPEPQLQLIIVLSAEPRSKAEFISKIGVVVEEADEVVFWLELLVDTRILSADLVKDLLKEANELLAIFAASQRTAKGNKSLQ